MELNTDDHNNRQRQSHDNTSPWVRWTKTKHKPCQILFLFIIL